MILSLKNEQPIYKERIGTCNEFEEVQDIYYFIKNSFCAPSHILISIL